MNFALLVLGFGFLIVGAGALFVAWKKAMIDTTLQVQSHSGDAEVMVLTKNLLKGESDETKSQKIAGMFKHIQDRRDYNHEQFLKIKAQAIKENEEKLANGEELTLRSVTEGKKA